MYWIIRKIGVGTTLVLIKIKDAKVLDVRQEYCYIRNHSVDTIVMPMKLKDSE